MSFNLIAKKLDLDTGGERIVLLNEDTAIAHGINAGDHIVISKSKGYEIVCVVDTTHSEVDKNHIGIYEEVYNKYNIKSDEIILVDLLQKPISVEYIKKKIKNHSLEEKEIRTIIQDIVDNRLGVIEKTYFLSTVYNPGYNNEELQYLTKSIAEVGETLKFDGIVADKHSIGGVAGKGITPIVVSIVASFGIKIPNTSTRSITTPAGTTDILETVTKVSFSQKELYELMEKQNAFMVWGGGLNLAPADEELIRIERPVGIESFDKFIVSILAKKVAMGITHLVIDIPVGTEYKVASQEDLEEIRNKFKLIAEKFGIEIEVLDRHPEGIDGNGVGPMLEMREVLYVLENSQLKSQQLEDEAVKLAGVLLEMVGTAAPNMGTMLAKEALNNGKAFEKFKDIIFSQGGNRDVKSDDLSPKSKSITFKAVVEGNIKSINNKKTVELARILGCPLDKSAGIYFYKKPGDISYMRDKMFSVYSTSSDRLDMALAYVQKNNLFIVE